MNQQESFNSGSYGPEDDRCCRRIQACSWVVAALVLAFGSVALPAAAGTGDQALSAQQRTLSAVAMPSSDLAVEVWIDRPSGVYGQGEPVGIYVRPSEAAHVTVFNTNASGATTVVFPNQYQTQNRVAANQVLQVPGPGMQYQLLVGPPFGANLIKVLATKRPVSLLAAAEFAQSGAFRNFRGSPEALARQLNVVAEQAPDAGWANAELTFVSAPSAGASPAVTVLPAVPGRPTSGIPALDALLAKEGGFGLQLALHRDGYAVGEALTLTAVAERDCSLTLVSIDEGGEATVLVPNRLEKRPELTAGTVRFLPGTGSAVEYRVSGAGRQALVGFCAAVPEKPGFWAQLFGKSRGATAVLGTSGVDALLAELAQLSGEELAHTAVGYSVRGGK